MAESEVTTIPLAAMSPQSLREIIVKTRTRYREIDHEDWDGNRYRRANQGKWEQAAREMAPAEWVEPIRILAQGWDYYGGSDLRGENTSPRGCHGRA